MWTENLEWIRPVASAMLLPPVPMLGLLLVGTWLALRRKPWRKTAAALFMVSIVALWLSSTQIFGQWLERRWVYPIEVLSPERLIQLKAQASPGDTAILVLGGGRLPLQVETGAWDLTPDALARLRYAVWLHRQTRWPLAFSGGSGLGRWGDVGPAEAQVARDILARDYGLALTYVEDQSRYTRENARLIAPILAKSGIKKLVLVTHAYHMPRSLRAFETEAGVHELQVIAAPMGFSTTDQSIWLTAMPSVSGFRAVYQTWRERVGWALGR